MFEALNRADLRRQANISWIVIDLRPNPSCGEVIGGGTGKRRVCVICTIESFGKASMLRICQADERSHLTRPFHHLRRLANDGGAHLSGC